MKVVILAPGLIVMVTLIMTPVNQPTSESSVLIAI